ncbi:BURP domain-containing protein 12-like [Hordeum vulgare subsp. vulgare]|uniref:Predicted protein n=1 Tax=Hordeum vulgare subsp. vulgare TaxID=112509 RepID=F2D4N8_HORVV|nr:BURP domain-containing protein 12-like [Hordeum vulgare subsp. vulgare]BAJ90059.1 predicted protein [Hordeum vulgare subsp. vulgare]
MDLFLPLLSFLLILGGQGSHHASFADAPKMTLTNMETLMAYWEAALPGIPIPAAISDLLAQQKGLPKIGPNYERVKSEAGHRENHVHIISQVEDDLKEAHGYHGEQGIKKVVMAHEPNIGKHLKRQPFSDGLQAKNYVEEQIAGHRTKIEENLKEISVSYGSEGDHNYKKVPLNLKKIVAAYTPLKDKSLKEISVSYGLKVGEAHKEVSGSYGLESENNLKEISLSYGVNSDDTPKEESPHEENVNEISVSYGLEGSKSLKKVPLNLKKILVAHTPWKDGNLKEISVSYGSKGQEISKEAKGIFGLKGEKDLKEISVSYGVDDHENMKEISVTYGSKDQETLKESSGSYGFEGKKDLKEISVSYGAGGHENLKEISVSYGSKDQKNHKEGEGSYALKGETDIKEISVSYGVDSQEFVKGLSPSHEENPKEVTISYGSIEDKDEQVDALHKVKGEGSHHVHTHSYKNKKEADVFFFQDMLRPGSLITPTIPPTTSMPALLSGDVADSIPFSAEHLSDIITMFAPASLAMTREIRWTLDTCEHPRTLPGQKAGCATSLESLAELPASLLGRRNIRAFSAMDLPMDAPGTPALRGKYNVTAARKLSGSSSEVVTCHDLTYPYAVYYCHTSSPTAAYMVTLTSVEEDTSPATMEVMAVCHLDTSLWSPKNPFFELHKVGPGDVAVCHFLTKLSIIWVSVDGHVDAL